jgi:long-chain fatty acid transport protein
MNGNNLIGIGPISRTMGGVGVAAPQDVVSAISVNPAGLSGSEAVFAVTVIDPQVRGKIDLTGMGKGVAEETSQMKAFVIPAIGVSSPITDKVIFGIGLYGSAGMGVDYKNTSTLFSDLLTKLEITKLSPAIAYLISPNLSVGASISVSYGDFDLGSGSSHDYSIGGQAGVIYRTGIFRIGASYTTPQKTKHNRLKDLSYPRDGILDTVKLESPMSIALGVAIEPANNILLEADTKWYNWEDAEGYKDFDWEDQWVFSIGIQYKPIPRLSLRTGFNYGESPVREHNGFNPLDTTNFQGITVSTLELETLRLIGSPVIIERHLAAGIGYEISEKLVINIGYAYAFEETISETSSADLATLESKVKGSSYEFGIIWKF